MKPRRLIAQSLLFLNLSGATFAADIVKANNTTALDTAASWTGGNLPTASDIAVFTNGSGTTASIGTGITLAGLRYTNAAAYNITVGTGALSVGSSGIDMTAATANHTISAPLILGANQQWNIGNGRTLTISGATGFNQGTNSVSMNGIGTVTFTPTFGTAANTTANGSFTINGGLLLLSTGNTTGFPGLTNIISPLTPLSLGGGTFQTTVGNSVGTYTQSLGGLTIATGASIATQARGSSSAVVVNFGAISRNVGGTLNLTPTSNNSGFRTSTANVNGMQSGAITLNGTDFAQATNATTNIGAATYVADIWATANKTNVTADTSQSGATTHSLRFAAAAARTLTLTGINTISSGGLLISSGVGANNNLITGGSLRGPSGGDLIVHQHNASGILTIASEIADNTTATALTKTGTGTLVLSGSNSFTGNVFLNAGTLQLASAGAINTSNPNQVVFPNNSSAKLQLFSNNITLAGVNTSQVLAASLPVMENGGTVDSILTVSNIDSCTFGGIIQNGSTGRLGLTKTNVGTLTLSGTNNSTGPVRISAGTLALSGSASLPSASITIDGGATLDLSARSGGGLSLASTQSLAGSGTITGGISAVLGSKLIPGANGNIGTLTLNSLNLGDSASVDFELAGTGTSGDAINVTTANGLVLGNGILVNLSPTGGGQFANGIGNTYTLFQYSGTLSGNGTNTGTITPATFTVANPVGGLTYTFQDTGTAITLTIGGSLANDATWQGGQDLSWNNGANWNTGTVPQIAGDSARFGNSIGTTPTSITLDGTKTVALLEINSTGASYTFNTGSGGGMILDNGSSTGQITITAGNHTINTPVTLSSSTLCGIVGSSDSLTLSSELGGTGDLTKTGAGLLHLGGSSTHTGIINLNGGTTSFVSGSLGTSGALNFGGGTLRFASGNTEDISLTRTTSLLVGGGTFDTNGNLVELTGSIQGSGSLTKTGSGTLTLAGTNAYTGNTIIGSGTLKINAVANLGATPATATPGNINIGSGALHLNQGLTLPANRGLALTSPTSSIVLKDNTASTISGIIAGTGKLNLSGAGYLTLTGANTHSGGNLIQPGALVTLNSAGALGTGQTELDDSQLTINVATTTFNNIFVAEGNIGIVDGGVQQRPGISGLGGAGDVTFLTRSGGNNAGSNAFGFRLQGSYSSFSGTLRLKSAVAEAINSFPLHFNGGGFNGDLSRTTVILSDYSRICGINNSGGNTVNIGALSGDTTAILAGADYAGSQTYNIGAKNLDTTFDGLITNGSGGNAHLIKSGSGSLTLTGANTYLGTTTVNTGTLAITHATALGADSSGTSISGGDVDGRLSVSGGLTITEPLTLGGRQGLNYDSPHILNVSGNNQLTAATIVPATGGNTYNVKSNSGLLSISGSFTPSGTVTGSRYLQLFGEGNGEWLGAIQNGTAVVSINKYGAGSWTLAGDLSYTGDTNVDAGSLILTSTSELRFKPTANGITNKIGGFGSVSLDGKFTIDLASANITNQNSWQLVDVNGLTETYGSNFSVTGFTKSGTDWILVDGANTWTFSQTTGALSLAVITDPFIPWISTHFPGESNASIIGKNADPDNDGLNNLAEFALNSSPSSSSNSGKVIGKVATLGGNQVMTLTLPVRAGATFTDDATTHEEVSGLTNGVIYRIQGSANLSAWTMDVSEVGAGSERDSIQAGLPALDTGWSYRTFRATGTVSAEPSIFLRVKLTE